MRPQNTAIYAADIVCRLIIKDLLIICGENGRPFLLLAELGRVNQCAYGEIGSWKYEKSVSLGR
jgi:hypothetical protein